MLIISRSETALIQIEDRLQHGVIRGLLALIGLLGTLIVSV